MRYLLFLLPIFLLTVCTQTLQANIIHVPGDSTTIQGGINGAVDGDTVLISPGRYYEHNIDFLGKAITVMSTDPEDSAIVDSTLVDANSIGRVFQFRTQEDSMSILAGLTITGGSAIRGGGVYMAYSSPTISNNVLTGNWAEYGGGIACYDSSAPMITDNIITENTAVFHGAGIRTWYSSPTIVNNTITGNTASKGGGGGILCSYIPSPKISSNFISENTAGSEGGGIYSFYSEAMITDNIVTRNSTRGVFWSDGVGGGILSASTSSPSVVITIENNIITDNQALAGGGGVGLYGGSPVVSNNVIKGNKLLEPYGVGGGIAAFAPIDSIGSSSYLLTVNNNIIENNTSLVTNCLGGGIYVRGPFTMTMANNTVTANSVFSQGGATFFENGVMVTIINSILWDNYASTGKEMYIGGEGEFEPCDITIHHSDLDGGAESVYVLPGNFFYWGDGMISKDPLFVTFHGFDYLLEPGSPAIDTGDPSIEDGFEWPNWYQNGPRSDMGAYGGPGNVGWLPQ